MSWFYFKHGNAHLFIEIICQPVSYIYTDAYIDFHPVIVFALPNQVRTYWLMSVLQARH